MTSGATAAHTGHSGRRLSCNMQSMTTRATGMVSRQSSSPPMSIHSAAASPSAIMVPGQYHTWPKAMTARNAAVQRLSRNGGVTSAAKALPRRNSR